MMQRSLAALQGTPDRGQAKNNLLRVGNCAKNPMRLILNSWIQKPFGTPMFQPRSVPRVKRFKIYYSSRKNGEYLRQLINSSGIGIVAQADHLNHLPAPGVGGVDVVIVEYPKNNSTLDRWIQESASNPQGPAIFLYVHKFPLLKLWKAMRLGIKECLVFPVEEEHLQAAVNRL